MHPCRVYFGIYYINLLNFNRLVKTGDGVLYIRMLQHNATCTMYREIGCFTCLLMRLRHVNVLQYRESMFDAENTINITFTVFSSCFKFFCEYEYEYQSRLPVKCKNSGSTYYIQQRIILCLFTIHRYHIPASTMDGYKLYWLPRMSHCYSYTDCSLVASFCQF